MLMEDLMSKGRPIMDGLADWLEMEAGLTERTHLREKFKLWAAEVTAVQQATQRVTEDEQ